MDRMKNSKKAYPLKFGFLLISIIASCTFSKQKEIHPAFYFWKTIFHLSEYEQETMDSLRIEKLYVRFFDVDLDSSRKAIPLGVIRFVSSFPSNEEMIPVIYIRNHVFDKCSEAGLRELAGKIKAEVNMLIGSSGAKEVKEVQIDCDWTLSTRSSYFFFLEELKKNILPTCLSATIRLHQVKYASQTGVPPVDRGMLMFYNMGKLKPTEEKNSIYNEEDADKYSSYIHQYALPLDIALPIFSWAIHIRGGKIIGLLEKLNPADFRDTSRFSPLENGRVVAKRSFFLHGNYIMKEDGFKLEEIDPDLCMQAADKVSGEVATAKLSVVLFDLDSANISRYEKGDLKKVFNYFH